MSNNFKSRIKYFVPVWLFPFIAIFAAVNQELNGAESTWFNEQLVVLLFPIVNLPIMYKWITGKIPAKELIIFWVITPALIWVGLVNIKLVIIG